METREAFFFSSFSFLFVSFLPFFLIFFLFRSRKWGRNGVRMDSDLFPFEFLFMEKRERINWKNLKEILSIFLLNFLSFFFLKTLLFFSFFFFFGRGKRIEEIAFFAIIHFYKNIIVLANPIYSPLNKIVYRFVQHKTA